MTSPTTVVRGTGIHLAEGVVTNERISRLMDTSDAWIAQRTGILLSPWTCCSLAQWSCVHGEEMSV